MKLYHGTTLEYSELLLSRGWSPNQVASGANQGQPKYLYLSTSPEDALWFSEQKGEKVVLEVEADMDSLKVDPEDGVEDSVEKELESSRRSKMPAKLVLFRPLAANCFKRII